MATSPGKRPGGRVERLPNIRDCSKSVFAFDDPQRLIALLLPDQIKPIGHLVPVS